MYAPEQTTSYWANFVKTGNPNGDRLANWPALDVNNPVTMELGDRFEVRPIADTGDPHPGGKFDRAIAISPRSSQNAGLSLTCSTSCPSERFV
jgi:hypothetical protein